MIAEAKRYDLLPALRADEFAQLEADIRRRGVLVPVEVDDTGCILDGHHRAAIAEKLGIDFPTVERRFASEAEKLEHVLKINLCRRHLDPVQWGQAFSCLLQVKGVRVGRGARNDATSATIAEVAAEFGVPLRTAEHRLAQARALESLPPEDRAQVEAGELTLAQARRATKERAREQRREVNRQLVAEAPTVEEALQEARFSAMVIDPPWDLGEEGELDQGREPASQQGRRGSADQGRYAPPYPTMRLEQLTALPVGRYADDDCHCYLWITNRSLFKGQVLLESWGFRYVTCLTWCKPSIGLGTYFRGQTEHVLFGVRGSQPLKRNDVGTWFAAPRGPLGHSSKPAEFYELVESCSPGPYLELFARTQRPGWTCWGAEVKATAATELAAK